MPVSFRFFSFVFVLFRFMSSQCVEALGGVIIEQKNLAHATHVIASEVFTKNFFSCCFFTFVAVIIVVHLHTCHNVTVFS